jgi:hypothetical protein
MNTISTSRKEARERLSFAFYCSRPFNKKKSRPVHLHKDSTPTERLEWIKQTAGSLAELVIDRDVTVQDLNAYQELLDKQRQDRERLRKINRTKSIQFEYKMLLDGKDEKIKDIAKEYNPAFQKL